MTPALSFPELPDSIVLFSIVRKVSPSPLMAAFSALLGIPSMPGDLLDPVSPMSYSSSIDIFALWSHAVSTVHIGAVPTL